MSTSRQLAAILFADIQGYTALMQDDEAKANSFREKLKRNLDEETLLHNGRILKLSGDGALCSFNSAIEAVRAAIGIQEAMFMEPKVPLRIGIHLGDVMFEDGDVYGDGVNVASRIESFAVPEAVFISGKVFDEIKNQKDIEAVSLGRYLLKNVKEPVEIYAISNSGLQVPDKIKLAGKGVKYSEHRSVKNLKSTILKIGIPIIAACILGFLFIPSWFKKQNARNVLLPAIQRLVDENFRPPTEALDMAVEAEKYIPADSALIKLWPLISTDVSFETNPAAAEVFWKDYDKPEAAWRTAGTTPLKGWRFPRGYVRMEIRKNGFQTIEYAGPWAYGKLGNELSQLKLDSAGSLPENMVRIPMSKPDMYIVGLEQYGGKNVGEFLIDKYEVTNKDFKIFMDAGGYTHKLYWNHPVSANGKEIPLDSALVLFTDKTGRQGPANWEAGTYPDGQENFPVTGVSWYEASAYGAYVKKQLPTVFHWGAVAATSRTQFIVPLSNFNGKSAVDVGSNPGYCSFGVYDLAGNAREWCFNESTNRGQHFILGGGWNDPKYAFNDSYTQSASDRSITNGFRCIKELPGDTTLAGLTGEVSLAFRDYRKEKPVDDKTFAFILNQYAYDKKPLDAKTEKTIEGESWIAEKISFDAGYNNERLDIYLYLPKKFKAPFQPVLFFPGSGDIFSKQYDPQSINGRIDFILKSGRAIIRPIYKGTHERHDDLKSDLQDTTVFYKDHIIMWRKEIGRTIDFLETRADMQADKVGFLGWSWGGFLGGIIPAIEKRIKVVVLNVGGMEMHKALPEADQINFLPRVTQPVLMLNGKHDMYFPVETSQKPMYDLLGSPKEDKKIIIYESGHLVPRTDFVKETLLWYDKYLGRVK
ncbi:MAG: SUMF1/EgtB/PvdO family nonheme iron enzyme [Bacteroidia bacterium]